MKRIGLGLGRKAAAPAAFSLVEMIVVIAIIGVLAAIAVPRLSRGLEDAAPKALQRDWALLQKQMECYAAEHNGVYPAAAGDGTNAAHTSAVFLAQVRLYTNIEGRTSATADGTFRFGPYLRGALPVLRLGPHAGRNGIRVLTGSAALGYQANDSVGWVYHDKTGEIIPNIPDAAIVDLKTGKIDPKKWNDKDTGTAEEMP